MSMPHRVLCRQWQFQTMASCAQKVLMNCLLTGSAISIICVDVLTNAGIFSPNARSSSSSTSRVGSEAPSLDSNTAFPEFT